VNTSDNVAEGVQRINKVCRDELLGPFITAACTALSEMAGAEVVVRTVYQEAPHHPLGDIAAVVSLSSATERFMVLSFPHRTAAALATRILAGAAQEVNEDLIRDCVGEIANVVAGQAKAMLAGGPYRFAFSIPQVVADASQCLSQSGLDCLGANFSSDQGEFTLQLFQKR
jgi:chemotaxis protein CheX